MEFLRLIHLPRRLSPRVWLVSLPSALISFERRQGLPKLPIGRWRFLGLPLIAAGLALWASIWSRSAVPPLLHHRTRWTREPKPSVTAGLMVLGGVALLLRSLLLALYSLALAVAAGSRSVTVEEPRPDIPFSNSDRPQ